MDANQDKSSSGGFAEPSTEHGAWEYDPITQVTTWSDEIYAIHGVSPEEFELTVDSVRPLIHPDDQPSYQRVFRNAIAARTGFKVKHRVVRPDGAERTVVVRGAYVPPNGRRGERFVGTTEDVTGRVDYEEKLWQLANRDPLTNLFNRRRFMEELSRELAASHRIGEHGAVIILDVDDFKDINDSLGHPAGDALLSRVGNHLHERMRTTDTLARIGGDEFALVLPSCDALHAKEVADSLIAGLEAGPTVMVAGRPRSVTASIGIAIFKPESWRSAEQLMVEADLAMYRAKEAGGGRVEIFDEQMRHQLASRMEIEAELREALERGVLAVHYQPITSLPDAVPIGCEALVRWPHPTRGMLPPGQFIPLAEESGLISQLGAWVLAEACRQAQEWRAAGRHLHVSVNVSPVQLLRDDVVALVTGVLRDTGLPPQLLYLEVTETSLIEEAEAIAPALQTLKDLGVKIAIDDFGGGSSSLSYLSVLPVDVVKIDRLFVDGLPDSDDDRAIVSAVLSLCEELELTVIAEGIEHDRQHWELRELGCRLGQGFLYSKARPAAELELDGFSTAVQPGVGDPSQIREFMRQIGIPARVG